jgi:plasmid stability protein
VPSLDGIDVECYQIRMSVLSIRNLPEDVARALKRLAGERGQSVEALVRAALIQLTIPTAQTSELEFWAELRGGLKASDVEALSDACAALDDAPYTAVKFE